jgi:hypothetical protein
MTVDLAAAADFMAGHARVLDRRRFDRLFRDGDPEAVLAAADAYRNPDGGYGWGLEPDFRSVTSQPPAALHAFEAIADAAPVITERSRQLCDWLAGVTLDDGGLPFALPVPDPAGCAPFWACADSTTASLQITSIVVANAHRVAEHDGAVAGHPWLRRATDFCLTAIRGLGPEPHAIELAFAVRFLDAVAATRPEARELLEHVRPHIPDDGMLHVAGGAEDEYLRPLDLTPKPDRPSRALFRPERIEQELDRLEGQQRDDGGWTVDFASYSPAATLEWRGYRTVEALTILRDNGRLSAAAHRE